MFTCIGYYKGEEGYCHIYIDADYDYYNGDYTLKDEISILFLVHKSNTDKMVKTIIDHFNHMSTRNKMISYYKGILKTELREEVERLEKLGVVFGKYFDKIWDRLVLEKI